MTTTTTNPFGGKNKHSLYVPMSETEQEVIQRLIENKDLSIHIKDWGIVHNPLVSFGDLRISFKWTMTFNAPDVPQPIYFFDIELKSQNHSLYTDKQPTVYNGLPIQACTGLTLNLAWDIALHSMDPDFVKAILPGQHGLTTKRGNQHLTPKQKHYLALIHKGNQLAKQYTLRQLKPQKP